MAERALRAVADSTGYLELAECRAAIDAAAAIAVANTQGTIHLHSAVILDPVTAPPVTGPPSTHLLALAQQALDQVVNRPSRWRDLALEADRLDEELAAVNYIRAGLTEVRRLGDRASFAIEIAGYYSHGLRMVDLWAAGRWLTTDDNAAYVPLITSRLQAEAAYLRSGRMPASPFPGMPASQVHRVLYDDKHGELPVQYSGFMRWGETVDNVVAYAHLDGGNLVFSFQFWREEHPYPQEIGQIYVVRMPAAEFAATLEAAAGILLTEHPAQVPSP